MMEALLSWTLTCAHCNICMADDNHMLPGILSLSVSVLLCHFLTFNLVYFVYHLCLPLYYILTFVTEEERRPCTTIFVFSVSLSVLYHSMCHL